ncbi:MAG: hypothetical protein ACRD3Q_16545 [Terriglobales bacterium]
MQAHRQFEELCALAVTGQITGESMSLLDAHVKGCDECRRFLQELGPFKAHVAPMVAASHAQDLVPPEGIRERFLARAAAAGLSLNPGPVLAGGISAECAGPEPARRLRVPEWMLAAWRLPNLRYATVAAACVLCSLAGFVWARRNVVPIAALVQPSRTVSATVAQQWKAQQSNATISSLESEAAQSRAHIEAISADLERTSSEKKNLTAKLATISELAARGAQVQAQLKAEDQKLQAATERLQQLQIALDDERQKSAVVDAILVAQQKATEDANARSAKIQADLDRIRDNNQMASGDFSQLIAARNLHIVDVYDTEGNGKRQRAFGRVFYVEGRSLVFYAYDLPATGKDVRLAFKVWGERAGVGTVNYSLGSLRSDDHSQRRWVLTCDDPKVLARIDAVYITAEKSDAKAAEPHGRKLMYAFLGNANHP